MTFLTAAFPVFLATLFSAGTAPAMVLDVFKKGLICSSRPEPTTTYRLLPVGDGNLQLDWHHANGLDFIPIHEGIVVPADLIPLEKRATILRDLGAGQQFILQASNCTDMGEGIIQCRNYKSKMQEINGYKVRLLSTYTARQSEVSYVGTWVTSSATMHLEIDGKQMFVSMKYASDDCRPIESANDRRKLN